MNIKSLAAGALAALAATSASAFYVGPGGPLGTIDNIDVFIDIVPVPAGIFQQVYSFTLADPGKLSGAVNPLDGATRTILGLTVTLQDASFAVIGTDKTWLDGFTFSGLAAGTYALNVLGYASGTDGGAYFGGFKATTAPVPEPQTCALMLAGLAAVGYAASRRKSKA